jgi:hypothetical protein
MGGGTDVLMHLRSGVTCRVPSREELADLVREDAFCNKVVSWYPLQMGAIEWSVIGAKPEMCNRIKAHLDSIGILRYFCDCQIKANAFGRSFLLLDWLDNGSPKDKLVGGNLNVELLQIPYSPDSTEWVERYKDNNMNERPTWMPMTGRFTDKNNEDNDINDDRIIDFKSFGNINLSFQQQDPKGYRSSLLIRFWEYYKLYKDLVAVIHNLISRKEVLVVKHTGLKENLSMMSAEEGRQYIGNIIRSISDNAFNLGVLLLDSEVELDILSREIGSLSQFLSEYRVNLIGASYMSEISLFGFSSQGAGLANLVDKDRESTNKNIDGFIRNYWKPNLDFIIKLCAHRLGEVDCGYTSEWQKKTEEIANDE